MVDQREPLSMAESPLKGERKRLTKTSGAEIKPERKRGTPGTFQEARLTLETSEGSWCTLSVVRKPLFVKAWTMRLLSPEKVC